MGLIFGAVILIVLGLFLNSDTRGFQEFIGQVMAIFMFYWLGSLCAPVSEVLGANTGILCTIAGFFYMISLVLLLMMAHLWIKKIINWFV